MTNQTNILRAFAEELARTFGMPELATTAEIGGEILAEIALTGQSNAFFKRLSASVQVSPRENMPGTFEGTLRTTYDHHGGGSNGITRHWIIATEPRYGQAEYIGCTPRDVFYALLSAVREAQAAKAPMTQA